MDAVTFWVNDEPGRVSGRLERADAIARIAEVFRTTPDDRFVEVVEKVGAEREWFIFFLTFGRNFFFCLFVHF